MNKKIAKSPLLLHKNVWHVIADALTQYLHSVTELKNLSCVSKDFCIIFANPNYVKFVLERNLGIILRRSFDLSTAELKRFLRIQRGSVLSGSVVLQAYTGDIWEDSDMDIYLPYLPSRYKNHEDAIMAAVPDCDFLTVLPVKEEYLMLGYHRAIVEVERPNGKKIQFIFVTSYRQNNPHVGRIVKTFDLTIVQNYYDGEVWRSKNIGHIIDRRMQLATQHQFTASFSYRNVQRIKKYEGRGFTFVKTAKPLRICSMAWMYIDDVYKTAEGTKHYFMNLVTTYQHICLYCRTTSQPEEEQSYSTKHR